MPQKPGLVLLLLALLLAGPAGQHAVGNDGWRPVKGNPWPPPGGGGGVPAVGDAWADTLAVLWNKTQDSIGFCIGRSPRRALDLLAVSWPWPLPADETGRAGVCSNRSRIDVHLCGPLEIEQYYKASKRKALLPAGQRGSEGTLRQYSPHAVRATLQHRALTGGQALPHRQRTCLVPSATACRVHCNAMCSTCCSRTTWRRFPTRRGAPPPSAAKRGGSSPRAPPGSSTPSPATGRRRSRPRSSPTPAATATSARLF